LRKYRLDCQCGAAVDVGAGQAGGETVCDACGSRLAVPKLRDLSQLPPAAADPGEPRAGWGFSQGVLLAGCLIAVVGWGSAGWLGQRVEPPVNPEGIRQNVARQTNAEIYRAWKEHFSITTVSRPPLVIEKQFAQQTFLRQGIAVALLGVGGVGALMAVAGGIGVARRRR